MQLGDNSEWTVCVHSTEPICWVAAGTASLVLLLLAEQIFLAGLVFCWLGDALLLPPGQTIWFQLGIASFLLGHVAYAVAVFKMGIDGASFFVGVLLLALLGGIAYRWIVPHVPSAFRFAVTCYVLTIGVMVAFAIGASAKDAGPLVALGAFAFALSDLSVARERFIQPSYVNSLWGLPLYSLAQGLLAVGMASSPVSP